MSNNDMPLPAGFEALAPFVATWSLASAAARSKQRSDTDEAERLAFYQAALAVLPAALAHLDQKPLALFDDKDQNLMRLMLSLAHVALAVETQAQDEAKHAEVRQFLHITRAMSDL
jgi:hypothetical protein